MATQLDHLLEHIDYRRTIGELTQRIDQAARRFPIQSASIRSLAEFQQIMASYYHCLWFTLLGLSPDEVPPHEEEYGLCVEMLEAEFGGFENIISMAFTGEHGGLRQLLRVVADRLIQECSTNAIRSAVADFWLALTVEEQTIATDEYIKKYGHLYPPEMLVANSYRLRMNIVNILANHPLLMQRLGMIGR